MADEVDVEYNNQSGSTLIRISRAEDKNQHLTNGFHEHVRTYTYMYIALAHQQRAF